MANINQTFINDNKRIRFHNLDEQNEMFIEIKDQVAYDEAFIYLNKDNLYILRKFLAFQLEDKNDCVHPFECVISAGKNHNCTKCGKNI